MSAFQIDSFEFCRVKERREGQIAVSDLPRLSSELVDTDKTENLKWSLAGGNDRLGNAQLKLSVAGNVKLLCQRCLKPLEYSIASESVLTLAKDEASADEIEQLLDDDDIEVIVGSRDLNLHALIEDEALLALPVSPKHEICPGQDLFEEAKVPKKESPFAVLKNLKK
jgi:uncharacterized protein